MRVGFGYDSHRFEEAATKPLVLGGIVFEGERGLQAHSDGDVVVHAVIDALLGAAGLGNIGSHFPDTDPAWANADSTELLAAVVRELAAAGKSVGNVDVTVICERPRIGPKSADMERRLGALVGAPVSVKGKTNERLDDIGAGLGIEVHAVCLLQ